MHHAVKKEILILYSINKETLLLRRQCAEVIPNTALRAKKADKWSILNVTISVDN